MSQPSRGGAEEIAGKDPLFGPDLLTPRRSGRIQRQVAAGNQPALHGATVALLPEATRRYAEEKLRIAHLYSEHEVLRVGVLVPGPQRNRLIGGPEVFGPVQVVAHDSPVAAMHSELAGEQLGLGRSRVAGGCVALAHGPGRELCPVGGGYKRIKHGGPLIDVF